MNLNVKLELLKTEPSVPKNSDWIYHTQKLYENVGEIVEIGQFLQSVISDQSAWLILLL